ncbi:MAG: Translation initiation factor [Nocardia sp.]|uniref:hypothetical protein n=1 Tax=Nocardia sp. TaxID=1821 RepID=UPI002630276D|nr:hypothetical protein [Nocardia sp.]MCU1646067.1 Translation initiation factor [Nocardia sp.]
MTEDVSQLSVAELLARNGQQGAPSAGGGGRRRRSGRGLSVADLTGDIPMVRNGSSSHAASDEAAPDETAYDDHAAAAAPQPNSGETDYSNFSNYSNFPDYTSSPEPQPGYSPYSVPDPEPAYSPLSGPISFYDPLAPTERPGGAPSLPEPSGYQWSDGSDRYSGHSAPGPDQPRSGRRRKPDPLDADVSLAELEDPSAPPPLRGETGRRRRRFDPDDETTEVRPFRGSRAPEPGNGYAGLDSAMGGLENGARTRHLDNGPTWSPEPLPRNPSADRAPGFDPAQAAAPAAPPLSRSARRHAEAQREAEAERRPAAPSWPQQPEPQWQNEAQRQPQAWQPDAQRQPEPQWQLDGQRPPAALRQDDPRRDNRRGPEPDSGRGAPVGGLPAWSARRRPGAESAPQPDSRDQGSIPTAAWTSPDQDQQLVSGGTVAGDLLHNALEREDQRAEQDSRRGGKRRAGGSRRRGAVEEHDPDEHLTEVFQPLDDDYDDEYDDDDDYDDEPRMSLAERFSALTSKLPRPAPRGVSAPSRSRGKQLSEQENNRRQWLILAGQSAGAAVAGMLLFKGFERMWEMLPWVALALAMIVILGLVALVRVLRRTDDIFSTVIAVVVGVFVTLGPLAFLLSTN